MRPGRVVVVAGTGTEIGKTWVGARVIEQLRALDTTVIARKPAQSFEATDTETDASILAAASGEDPAVVCPPHRWYPVPMAPPMAAVVLERPPFTTADLAGEVAASFVDADIALVETAGGAWSPQASDGLHVGHFADALAADAVLLVADAGLGTINAVRGAIAALGSTRPVVVVLNRFDTEDELHARNFEWLRDNDGLVVASHAVEAAVMLAAL